jgi:hypothetical protein
VYWRYFFDLTGAPLRPDHPLMFDSMAYYDEIYSKDSEIDASLIDLDQFALSQAASQRLHSGVYYSAPGAFPGTTPRRVPRGEPALPLPR